jgi:hypothetical protein
MPFVLSNKPSFKYTVKVKRPGDGGALEEFEFLGEYKRLPQPEIDELIKRPPADAVLVERVFLGWSGVKTMVKVEGLDVEQDLQVTPDNRVALLAEPGARAAIVRAYLDAVLFGPAKN